jgi:transcriptional regulator with XRE-family HTH domain
LSSEMDTNGVDDFVKTVAANIRALRQEAGMTLAELSTAAGLGKSTLAQLESGKGNPSVETLWALAAALRVPFGRLMDEHRPATRVVRASEQPTVTATETDQVGRLMAASHQRGTFEIYAMDLKGGGLRHADAHHAGVVEHLLVVTGRMRAGPESEPVELEPGDLVTFSADVPHVYEARGGDAHYVLLMSYP